MIRVGLASADWSRTVLDGQHRPTWGGSGWYRLGLPGRHLRAHGFEVVEGTLVFDRTDGVFGVRPWPTGGEEPQIETGFDLVVIQRYMFASVAVETATARRNGQVIVQDVDDHFWALDSRNRAAMTTDPRRNPIENRAHYLAALKAASAVTTSTPYLASCLKGLGVKAPIHVLPNRVDVEAFAEVRAARKVRCRVDPVVGWVGAAAWRSGDLETLRGVLGPFLDRHGLDAYHGGEMALMPGAFADQAGVDPARVTTAPLSPIETYPALFEPLDVGLVPLRDVIFNRAKSAIKGLEYAAAGVPFVAQDLPEYVRLHGGSGLGRIASRPRDWARHLESLLDPQVRAEEAAAGLEAVRAHDVRLGVTDWRDLYLDLVAG